MLVEYVVTNISYVVLCLVHRNIYVIYLSSLAHIYLTLKVLNFWKNILVTVA